MVITKNVDRDKQQDENKVTTSKPDELLPGFTRSVPLNIHKNSFVIIPNTFSKSCVLFGHHFSGQQIETSILPRVVLANEINKKYFFSNECLLVVVWKKTKSLSRIIIILIPRVHFNHINLGSNMPIKG